MKQCFKKIKNLRVMVIYYDNGDIYNGHLENGLKEGKGILIKKNGDKFEGIFKEDKEYTGINYLKNNKIRIEKGNIKENELILEIKQEDVNKEIQILNFYN